MLRNKVKIISDKLGSSFLDILKRMYISDNLSSQEISNKLFELTGIQFTARSVQRELKKNNLTRSLSDAFNLAISRGRKNYDHLRKDIKSSKFRHGIQPKLRYQIFKRDNFRCVICGCDAKNDILVVDHIVPVVNGGKNDLSNLRVLCRECNTGKMLLEEKHL